MKKIILLTAAMLTCASASADWAYDNSTDKMTGKKTSSATIESKNSLDLTFPYQGKNFGNILVRQHPAYGLNVIFYIDKGQILCRSYDGCSVTVRFDEKPPVKFSARTSADNDSKVIFLDNASRFIASAKTAKSILIQPTIYQAGAPVLEFSSSNPLAWGPANPSPAEKPAKAPTKPAQTKPAQTWPEVPASLSGNR